MSEDSEPIHSATDQVVEHNPARHVRRVLVALLGFGTLVALALVVIVSLLLLGGVLHRAV